jgi:hypothetical protein
MKITTLTIDDLYEKDVLGYQEMYDLDDNGIEEISPDNIDDVSNFVGSDTLVEIKDLLDMDKDTTNNNSKRGVNMKTETTETEVTEEMDVEMEKQQQDKQEEQGKQVAGVEFVDDKKEDTEQEEKIEFPFLKARYNRNRSNEEIGIEFYDGKLKLGKATYDKIVVNESNADSKKYSSYYGRIQGERDNGKNASLSFAKLNREEGKCNVIPVGYNLSNIEQVYKLVEIYEMAVEKARELWEK